MESPRFADICGICETEKTYKILAWDKDDNAYWLAGYQKRGSGQFLRLAKLKSVKKSENMQMGIPWLVFS